MTDEKPNDTETTLGGTPRPKRVVMVQAAIDAEIPQHRQAAKASDTQKGALIVVGGVALVVCRWKFIHEIPWWLGLAVIGFGVFSADSEWVGLKLKLALARVHDILDLVRGKQTPPAGGATP